MADTPRRERQGSWQQYDWVRETNVMIPLRDGVRLATDIYRPALNGKPVEGRFPFGASGRALSLNETEGWVKVVGDRKTDKLLGVHMIGPEVTELIAEAALAIEMGATVADVAQTIHAHPTLPEALMEAAESVHDMAVHIFQAPKKAH